jgi:uncharacterized protein YndB with AHSA1/START domain
MSALPLSNAENNPSERAVTMSRVYDAPRSLVFKAWADPKQLQRWWGPKGFTNPVCDVDLRVGGSWRIVMRAPNGEEYPGGGVYREIVEPERLVFTNNALDKDGNIILEGFTTVMFADASGKTKLTLKSRAVARVPYAAAYLQGMEAGWSQTLDGLAEEVAKQ